MVGFYKHDVAAWRGGTASLTHEQYRVYHVIIEEIMVQEGPILPHERMLAGVANMSVRAFKAALNMLLEAGKLRLEGGRLTNVRAGKELDFVRNNRENAKTGGFASGKTRREAAENPEKRKENKTYGEAPLPSATKPKREEKRREEASSDEEETTTGKRTRLPADWRPSEEERQIARDAGFAEPEIDPLAAEYVDYWHGAKGEKGKKSDWLATWRNRVTDIAARRRLRPPRNSSDPFTVNGASHAQHRPTYRNGSPRSEPRPTGADAYAAALAKFDDDGNGGGRELDDPGTASILDADWKPAGRA
jgi:uncharacterized protein YdaU (DUF1376 family)